MNVPEWLERASPGELLVLLKKAGSARKGGLFVRHLCRIRPEAFPDPRSLAALDAADRYEAGEIDEAALRGATEGAALAAAEAEARLREAAYPSATFGAVISAAGAARLARDVAERGCDKRWLMADVMRVIGAPTCPRPTSLRRAARTIRHVFLEHYGDVRRPPVAFEASWRTGPVLAVAADVYTGRAFCHMPVLADALEDAGCRDAELLAHCRGGGEHARGCWALDLALGKS